MTRWLVTGAGGQLGSHLVALLGPSAIGLARADLDITSADAVAAAVREHRPDVVVNAAAYTAVDAAESDPDAAAAVNTDGPAHLAAALAVAGGHLVHVSTDYVFDGTSSRPYEPDDPTGPRTVYGRTKLAGEQAVLSALPSAHVVRSAWVYGGPGPNFVDTMLRLERERPSVDVVSDQVGSPTWVHDLAAALIALGGSNAAPGVLHYVNSGTASWNDLAREVFRLAGADPERVRAVTSSRIRAPGAAPGMVGALDRVVGRARVAGSASLAGGAGRCRGRPDRHEVAAAPRRVSSSRRSSASGTSGNSRSTMAIVSRSRSSRITTAADAGPSTAADSREPRSGGATANRSMSSRRPLERQVLDEHSVHCAQRPQHHLRDA